MRSRTSSESTRFSGGMYTDGLATVGLRRAGIPAQEVAALKKALAVLRSGLLLREAIVDLERSDSALVREVAQFIGESKRGFTHPVAA